MTTQQEFYQALVSYKFNKCASLEPLHETVSVLSYEVGRMLEQAMYMHWSDDAADSLTRRGFLKTELMDAIAQCVLICEAVGADFEEMKEMGIEKALERFTGKEYK